MNITDEMIEAAQAELAGKSSYTLSPSTVERVLASALSASPAGPFEMRHDEGGYVEFLNEDVPTVVRVIDGRVAILTTLEQPRKVVGYRVYDPGFSPSEVFGSASPAGVVKPKPLEWVEHWGGADDDLPSWRGKNPLGLHVSVDFIGKYKLDKHSDAPQDELEAAKSAAFADYSARIMSAIEPAGVGVETPPPSTHSRAPYDLRLKIGKALDQIVCEDSTPEQVDQFIETFREFGLTISADERQTTEEVVRLRAALGKIADMIDAEDADLDDAISIASAALVTTEGCSDG